MTLLVLALSLWMAGAALATTFRRSAALCSALGAVGSASGCAAAAGFAVPRLAGNVTETLSVGWAVPGGAIRLACDPLSAFFLMPICVVGALTAIYGHAYLLPEGKHRSLAVPWAAFNLLLASMTLVVVSRNAVSFLVAWEVMSIAAYLLVAFDHEQPDVRRAGWVYLIATHVGTSFLLALFVLLRKRAGSFDFDAFAAIGPDSAFAGLAFLLALAGFGVKAGLVPFHVWLPEAHAAAPSHVSALMSGVLIKMGLYGILRVMLLIDRPAGWWGIVLMSVGLSGALLGVGLALYQRDLKRVLAYSSIENMGLVVLGLGVGMWGRAAGHPHVATLGIASALLHVWNHALMKGLMFLGAGSVLHATGTKDLEQLGGLMRRMPRTSTCLTLGAVAIAGLPPLNGFISEWLLYLGLIQSSVSATGATGVAALLSLAAVSLVGALAALCFVRLVGIALLGAPRSGAASKAHESPSGMLAPMGLLAAACAAFALAPRSVVIAFSPLLERLSGADPGLDRAPGAILGNLGLFHGALWVVIALSAGVWALSLRGKKSDATETWGCGYASPSVRMQYTGRSFSELASERLLPRWMRARTVRAPSIPQNETFPARQGLASRYDDPITRSVYEPLTNRSGDGFARLRWLQQGSLHIYLLYILVVVILGLSWVSIRAWRGG